IDFAAQYPACLCPCQRFTCSLNGGPRMTRGQVVCYSFPVGLFHSLSHAGLSRRTRRSSAAICFFLTFLGSGCHHSVYLTDSWVRLACLSWALTGARPVVLRAVHLAMSLATWARRSAMAADN